MAASTEPVLLVSAGLCTITAAIVSVSLARTPDVANAGLALGLAGLVLLASGIVWGLAGV